ncbi:carbonic anhydrase [Streptosporangium sp. NPDC006007]|uniref:carbonic anhydrase n=1 Tax=Streptosporangium sp. NPDC006007 TaxID=3154575 RepID=UPI0033AD3077
MNSLLMNARMFWRRTVDYGQEYRHLANGQWPQALFISCSDSRVIPALITSARPGDLFELRNAGNIVPPHDAPSASGEVATIEYAVGVLEVRNIVVCGHSHCGAVGAVVRGEDLSALPGVNGWLDLARPGLEGVSGRPPRDRALLEFVQRHVAAQLRTLSAYPMVKREVEAGRLKLHGWVYQVDTGELKELDEHGEFRSQNAWWSAPAEQ